MELINNNYVKFSKFDLCYQQVKESETGDENREIYFNKIMRVFFDYEREKKHHISYIYISTDNSYIKELLEKSEIFISRQTVLNALMFATVNNDIDIAQKLSLIISKKEFLPSELGNLLEYVLTHSMDINEYFDGEEQRFIYNDIENRLEEGYVFKIKQPENNKQLKLK
ncbi:MAG: hypothetical protein E7165_04155 [Firmicutes bacterium]|nr:hypothetical protein [Bacillota bacterium]